MYPIVCSFYASGYQGQLKAQLQDRMPSLRTPCTGSNRLQGSKFKDLRPHVTLG
jgi:hypothetical protein